MHLTHRESKPSEACPRLPPALPLAAAAAVATVALLDAMEWSCDGDGGEQAQQARHHETDATAHQVRTPRERES